MGHENGGWMNSDQRAAVADRASAPLTFEEWKGDVNLQGYHCRQAWRAGGIRRELLAEFGCDEALPTDCLCGHSAAEHRSGGLCEACMPVGDSTGAYSACQGFTLPQAPDAAIKARLRAALDRICPKEGENWRPAGISGYVAESG